MSNLILGTTGVSNTSGGSSYAPTVRNLTLGMTGTDVNQLQLFLIQESVGPAARKLAARGATGYFGVLTKAALIEFQESVGITPSSGYFGPITREWIYTHDLEVID
jgi:peptidoglycan hydrolase-like protein with peptidoglycan-binding domain